MYWIKGKDGKEYAVSFSQAAILRLTIMEGVAVNNMTKMLNSYEEWPISRVIRMYWLSVKEGMRKAGKEFNMTEDEFVDWLGDDETIWMQIVKAFEESNPQPDEKKPTARQVKK